MFKDIIYTNTEAFKRLGTTIKENILVLIVMMLGLFAFDYVTNLIAGALVITLGGGFTTMLISLFMYILMLLKFSLVASLLSRAVEGEKISLNSIFMGYKYYLTKLVNYVFITYLFGLVLDIVFRSGSFTDPYQVDHSLLYAKMLVNFIVIFIFNASFETLYQTANNSISIFTYGAKFFFNNFLQWLFAAILLVLVLNSDIFADGITLRYLVSYALMPIIFIYRGHLFKILDNSSMRMRAFRRRMD